MPLFELKPTISKVIGGKFYCMGGNMLATDGFSMGGYGSARLGFKYPEVFRAVSIVGAGPMQAELIQAPRAGRKRAAEVLAKVYGSDQAYFRAVSPRTLDVKLTTRVVTLVEARKPTVPAIN
jgi:pimeloyl-ACP methyl ester carboxylesterase